MGQMSSVRCVRRLGWLLVLVGCGGVLVAESQPALVKNFEKGQLAKWYDQLATTWQHTYNKREVSVNVTQLFDICDVAFKEIGLNGVSAAAYSEPMKDKKAKVPMGAVHHIVGQWAAIRFAKILGGKALIHAAYLNTTVSPRLGSVTHGIVWTWLLQHRELIAETSFWEVFDSEFGDFASAQDTIKLPGQASNAAIANYLRLYPYVLLHGAGHGAFLLAWPRFGWEPFHTRKYYVNRASNSNAPVVEVADFNREVIATCAQAPTAMYADACASGAYHSYFDHGIKHHEVSDAGPDWYWPCDAAPLGFKNVCFVMGIDVFHAEKSNSNVCSSGGHTDTEIACIYALAHSSVTERFNKNIWRTCQAIAGNVEKVHDAHANLRIHSCINGSIDRVFGDMYAPKSEAFCAQLGDESEHALAGPELVRTCVERSKLNCGFFGGCRASY